MSNTTSDGPRSRSGQGRGRRLVIAGLVALSLLVAVGLVYYWVDWGAARQDRGNPDYGYAYRAYLGDIEADRLDAAYGSTAASFQGRVSREAFEERVRRYLAFQRRPGARGVGGQLAEGPNQVTYTYTLEDGEGNRLQKSVTVVQEDSIFYRRPPPPRVADVVVGEVTPKAPGKP